MQSRAKGFLRPCSVWGVPWPVQRPAPSTLGTAEADNNTSTGANWLGGAAPSANDDLVFGGSLRLTPNQVAALTIGSLTFNSTAGAFTLGGAAYTINTSAGVTNNSTNTETINNAITLGIAQTWTASSGNLVFGGNVANGGFGLTVTGGFNTSITGILSGTGGLTKTGAGTLTLSGVNTYNGTTTVNAGAISISSASSLGTGSMTLNGGTLMNTATFTSTQPITLGASGGTLNALSGTTQTRSGVISGAGPLNVAGTGTLVFSAANTYTGITNVNSGVLNIQSPAALGTTAGGTTVASGAALQIQGGIAVGAEALTLNGGGIASDGALRNISGNNSWSGGITLGSASTIGSDSGNLTLGGVISGAFNLTKVGAGTLTLTNTGNSFTGTVAVQNGTLSYGTTVLGPGTNGVVLGGVGTTGTLQYTGPSGTTSRTYTLATGGTGVFDISTSASIFTISSVVAGTGNLRKAGSGTLLLSGAASYTGATRIDAGTLRLGIANAVPNTAVTVRGGSAGTTATLGLNGFNESLCL